MGSNLLGLIPDAVLQIAKIIVIVGVMVQTITFLVFFRQILSASANVHTTHIRVIQLIFMLYILLLLGILVFIIVY